MNKLLENLNEEQRKAAEQEQGPCMVLAGPGYRKNHDNSSSSGKYD